MDCLTSLANDERSPTDAEPQDPTPAEIRRACLQIQATWSEEERCFRAGARKTAELKVLQDKGIFLPCRGHTA